MDISISLPNHHASKPIQSLFSDFKSAQHVIHTQYQWIIQQLKTAVCNENALSADKLAVPLQTIKNSARSLSFIIAESKKRLNEQVYTICGIKASLLEKILYISKYSLLATAIVFAALEMPIYSGSFTSGAAFVTAIMDRLPVLENEYSQKYDLLRTITQQVEDMQFARSFPYIFPKDEFQLLEKLPLLISGFDLESHDAITKELITLLGIIHERYDQYSVEKQNVVKSYLTEAYPEVKMKLSSIEGNAINDLRSIFDLLYKKVSN